MWRKVINFSVQLHQPWILGKWRLSAKILPVIIQLLPLLNDILHRPGYFHPSWDICLNNDTLIEMTVLKSAPCVGWCKQPVSMSSSECSWRLSIAAKNRTWKAISFGSLFGKAGRWWQRSRKPREVTFKPVLSPKRHGKKMQDKKAVFIVTCKQMWEGLLRLPGK